MPTTLSEIVVDPASTASRVSMGTVGERVAAAVALFGIGDDDASLRQTVIDQAAAALRTAPARGPDGAPLFDSDEIAARRSLVRELRERFRVDSPRRWCGSYCVSLARTFLPGCDLSDVEIESHDLFSGAWIDGDLVVSRSRIDARPPLLAGCSARTSTSFVRTPHAASSCERSALVMTGLTVSGELIAEGLTVKGTLSVSGSIKQVRLARLLALGSVHLTDLQTHSVDLAGATIALALKVSDSTVSKIDLTGTAVRGSATFVRLAPHGSTVTADVSDAHLPALQFLQCPQLRVVGAIHRDSRQATTTQPEGR